MTEKQGQKIIVVLILLLVLSLINIVAFSILFYSRGSDIISMIDYKIPSIAYSLDSLNKAFTTPKSVKYEYKIISLEDQEFDSKMEEAGDNGWELVFARRAITGGEYSSRGCYECILKRPKI